MTLDELERRLDKAFSKHLRLCAENTHGQFSSTWMFWGNNSDFYFGAKSALGAFKVSLHENGRGYVAFHKPYYKNKLEEGIAIPAKTVLEWVLPKPTNSSAAHAASLMLPADYCRANSLSDKSRKNTLVLGIENGCCAEIGVFLSREQPATLESRLLELGKPMFFVTLKNTMHVALVARSRPFDRACIPTGEQMTRATVVLLDADSSPYYDNLNAMLWDDPGDGGTLHVVDVGGVRFKK